jgi:outer membrane protein
VFWFIFASMGKRIAVITLFTICFGAMASAQDQWDLRRIVEYALVNNISIKQADVQARLATLDYEQSRLALYPSANIQNNAGYQFGRSIDPSTNQFTSEKFFFASHALNVGGDLFNWFSKRNLMEANRFQSQAMDQSVDKARNDVALNVANLYLQILLNNEQVNISRVQVALTSERVENTRKLVEAEELPELNLLELEAQLAADSATLITAQSNFDLSILQLKAILNMDAASPFVVAIPQVDQIPVESLADLQPEKVYALALSNLPQQKMNDFNLLAAKKNVEAARGAMFPTLGFFGGVDTRYSDQQNIFVTGFTSSFVPIGTVTVGGTPYTVTTLQPQQVPTGFTKNTYFRQFENNFGQSLGLSLSIPIFNGGIARTNWKKAQLNVRTVELQKELDAQTIKQDIYQAYTSAVAALQTYNASKKSVAAAERAYEFSNKRYDIGLMNSLDLITNQNNLFRARINMASAQYDFIFRMKLLEFYKGQGLRL